METSIISPVTLTAGAIVEIRKLMAAEGFDTTQKLRVGVKGGGCSGMTYVLGFDHNRGFTFKNPNASTTCGCGTSFAV